jgi:hypothetical protein
LQSLKIIPFFTITELTGGVLQAVECLPFKYKVLSTNPSPTKTKKIQITKIELYSYTQIFYRTTSHFTPLSPSSFLISSLISFLLPNF